MRIGWTSPLSYERSAKSGAMNLVILTSRFPWPSHTGDRVRAAMWLEALAGEGEVALIAPRGDAPAGTPPFRFHEAARSLGASLRGVAAVVGGQPVQSLIGAQYDWAAAIANARRDLGSIDVAVVMLSRLDAQVRPHLHGSTLVLDAVDSLARSMGERVREASPLTRWFWREEMRRVERSESNAARAYDRVVAITEDDARMLGGVAVPLGVRVQPLVDAERDFDFGFWGRLAYFANADAARWLFDEVWPAIRARRPDATLFVGGADAPPAIRRMHGRDGITVQSPVDDIAKLARRIRVALFPVRYGTGQSNKVLEAAEGGCAIVATPTAMRALSPLERFARVAEDAESLADAAVTALEDSRASQEALRRTVERHYSRQAVLDALAALATRSEVAA